MKRWMLMIGALYLSSCTATPDDPVVESGFEPVPGLYATGDGTTVYSQTRLNADGTYVDLGEAGITGEGTWYATTDGMCFDPEGDAENQQERCWRNGPVDENGRFLSTRLDTGQSYFVKRIDD
ncbi:MAG: hypothetical protein HRT81_05540 [Henriciella sp.]|nr:hypothetical protein [Henriciella sp.]